MRLDEFGYVVKCDRCGVISHYTDENYDTESAHDITFELWRRIFYGRSLPKPLCGDFCKKCAEQITPLAYQFRDIDELVLFTNKLERAIREKRRTENNGAASHNASKRGKGRSQWRLGYRPGYGPAQTCEEHF